MKKHEVKIRNTEANRATLDAANIFYIQIDPITIQIVGFYPSNKMKRIYLSADAFLADLNALKTEK